MRGNIGNTAARFASILTPDQLEKYRRMKLEGIEEKAQIAEIVAALQG